MTEPPEPDKIGDWTEILKLKTIKKQLSEISREWPFKRSLYIDFREVERAGSAGIRLADDILQAPGRALEDIWDAIANHQLIRVKDGKTPKINIRFTNLPRKIKIRDIRAEDVNLSVSIEGMIVRVSEVRPRMTEAVFKCGSGHFTHRLQKYGHFSEPDKCMTDGCRFKKLDLIPARSRFIDSQSAKIQDSLEGQRPGEQPQSLSIDIEDDLCGVLVPGERVVINGILRSQQRTIKGEKSSAFDLFLQCNSIEHDAKNYGEIPISEEEEKEILRISKMPDLLTVISQSILPAISGLEEEKKGIALHLFSAHQDTTPSGKKLRGSIHVMIAGDPAISKTTLMLMLHDITPRSVFISGRETSSAGLTFAMRQDEFDKRWVADAGAAPQADESNLFVDELTLMEATDIMSLNGFMETQIIPIAKAGISATMNARCSTMVCLNPKGGRFDIYAPLADQLDKKIPPQLLSRFDLIYLLPDVPTEARDRKEADDILSLWQGAIIPIGENQIPLPMMQKYIAKARRRKNPVLNDAAKRTILEKFVEIRKLSGGTISITKRSLESLARLATAHAIMRFGDEVTVRDAEIAIKVLEHSLKQTAFDTSKGTYDADRVTGNTEEKRKLTSMICDVIKAQGGKCSAEIIVREVQARKPNLMDRKIRDVVDQMRREGALMEPTLGKYMVL